MKRIVLIGSKSNRWHDGMINGEKQFYQKIPIQLLLIEVIQRDLN